MATDDSTAKTGQSLIASSIFQDLPEAPEPKQEAAAEANAGSGSGMDVDPASTPTPAPAPAAASATVTSKSDAKTDGASGAATPSAQTQDSSKSVEPKKYIPVADSAGELLVECTVYLRLLLLLKSVDAKLIAEVSLPFRLL